MHKKKTNFHFRHPERSEGSKGTDEAMPGTWIFRCAQDAGAGALVSLAHLFVPLCGQPFR
jgi:hypothetical protein